MKEREIFRSETLTLDDDGLCQVRFALPADLDSADGTLVFTVADGGVVESIGKTIPILIDNYEIHFYPEGGELVAGLENRVYFQALRADGKPADLEGFITSDRQNAIVLDRVKSLHEGRGVFSFTPRAGHNDTLHVKPAASNKPFLLPEVKEHGVALRSEKAVWSFGEPIRIAIRRRARPAGRSRGRTPGGRRHAAADGRPSRAIPPHDPTEVKEVKHQKSGLHAGGRFFRFGITK